MKDTDRELLEAQLLRLEDIERRLKMLEDAGLTPNEVRAFRALVKGKQ